MELSAKDSITGSRWQAKMCWLRYLYGACYGGCFITNPCTKGMIDIAFKEGQMQRRALRGLRKESSWRD